MSQRDDEFELLMLTNPRGGKPQQIGKAVWMGYQPGSQRPDTAVDVSTIKEDTTKRFHLGYCKCGSKILAGEKRALVIIKTMQRILGIKTEEELDAKILSGVMENTYRRGE